MTTRNLSIYILQSEDFSILFFASELSFTVNYSAKTKKLCTVQAPAG
jgi:hypothetical protein